MSSQEVIPRSSVPYYLVCGVGGAVAAGATHLAITPLDITKCRMQVNPEKFPTSIESFRYVICRFKVRGLIRGWAPTAIGYGLHGSVKYGFYEVFKDQATKTLGEESAHKNRWLVYLTSAVLAEGIGGVVLAPFEAAKVRTQTEVKAPSQMRKCLPMIIKEGGLAALYKGIVPLWLRQIPYAVSKFIAFEAALEMIYNHYHKKSRMECTTNEQMATALFAGAFAGVVCAACSHPQDVLVSLMYRHSNLTLSEAVKKMDWKGAWLGLGPRMLMISSIVGLQLFIFDSTKTYFNLERSVNE